MKLGLRAPGKLTVTDPATDIEASGLEGRLLSYNVSTQNATSPPHVVQIHRQSFDCPRYNSARTTTPRFNFDDQTGRPITVNA
jgi:hypothetical protein